MAGLKVRQVTESDAEVVGDLVRRLLSELAPERADTFERADFTG